MMPIESKSRFLYLVLVLVFFSFVLECLNSGFVAVSFLLFRRNQKKKKKRNTVYYTTTSSSPIPSQFFFKVKKMEIMSSNV